MRYKILITKEAQVELGIAECYFSVKGIQRQFMADFFKQLEFLESTPYSFQIRYRDIRTIDFKQFNYSIHYVIKDQVVLILRILNQKQYF